ncbi:alpha/beta fold hydrolase [Streptacidiphilus sp. PAMC 29251]
MFTYNSSDGTVLHVHEWLPEGEPRGIVQIAHGMGDHAARYSHLAETPAAGFAVYADDHRGHGTSITGTPGDLGANGWNLLVEDLVALSELLKARHPGLPLVLVGHSLGSFASQQYILDHGDLLAGVAIAGTTAIDALLPYMSAEPDANGDVMAQFNAPFEPARTPFDWLTRDNAQVDAYLADPWTGFSLAPRSLGELFEASARWADPKSVPSTLPIYVFVGDKDPLNADLALTDLLVQRYRDAGVADVTYKPYPGGRHEILNETNRAEVEADLLAWIDRVTA